MTDVNDFLESVKATILGKKIREVREAPRADDIHHTLVLEDGTELILYESDWDCCAGAWGDWTIVNGLEAGITDVVLDDPIVQEESGGRATHTATLTLLHNQNALAAADLYADDGNGGYYFSTLSLRVKLPHGKEYERTILSTL